MAILKGLLVVSLVGAFTTLVVACKNDGESTCEKINDLCGLSTDCDVAGKQYSEARDKQSDAEKDADDKYIDCIDDAESCNAATACVFAAQPPKTGGADAGSDSGTK